LTKNPGFNRSHFSGFATLGMAKCRNIGKTGPVRQQYPVYAKVRLDETILKGAKHGKYVQP
jgi:hypothetical protein